MFSYVLCLTNLSTKYSVLGNFSLQPVPWYLYHVTIRFADAGAKSQGH